MNIYIVSYEMQGKVLRKNEVVIHAESTADAYAKFLNNKGVKDTIAEAWRVSIEVRLSSEI